jgi:oligoendopeptidase F
MAPDTAREADATPAPPEWTLADLYAAPDDPAIERDLGEAGRRARAFAEAYENRLARLDAAALGAAIAEYEAISETLDRVGSYGQLLFAANTEDPKIAAFYQTLNEKVTDISTLTLFFELELNRLDDAELDEKVKHPAVARYKPWLDANRAFKPYQLSSDLEKILHEKSVAGRAAWSRLFDETMAQLRFDIDGRKLSNSEILSLMSDRDGAKRKAAAKSFGKGLGDNIRLFALITNTLAKDKEIEDKWRKLPRPVSRRNISNQVEDEVVDALVKAAQDAYPETAHRYYKLKARWFGVDKLDYWDRNAPLPEADDSRIGWDEARETVLGSYRRFEPALADIAGVFFERRWIDANPRQGKDSGAFSHPTVPSVHPYILMNFHGKSRDVMTLAHELGHGIHQTLASPHGHFLSSTPLTLAETASVFGEMLTFRSVLDGAVDAKRRRVLLASKVEDMLNTVVRQIAFYRFEETVHAERRNGELSADRLGEIWMGIQTESLGPAFRFDEEYKHYWAYIPHFVHSPFYVYAYAFGDCLVNSLYDVFLSGHPGFQQKYLEMLKAGGTLRHRELLAPFGLDAGDPAFWKRGLSVVSRFIDELEASL